MKTVLVHDWLIHMRGGERVLEALAELYPDAEIYTLFYDRRNLSPVFQDRKIHGSFLHYFPGVRRYYRWLLPLMPWAIQSLKLPEADLVISSSHCVAKGVRIPQGAKHLCYVHTPMRYLWGFEEEYFGKFPACLMPLIRGVFAGLKKWDLKSNAAVDLFIANSQNVKQRIKEYYGRDAAVVYPPLDTAEFFPPEPQGTKENFYLVVSAFVPYKKVDLVIEAFNELPSPLKIVGSGPMDRAYRQASKSDRIEFLGNVTGADLRKLYGRAKALVFPTLEDFGIVPLEAQACGTAVIAYNKGGALESVKTGEFFDEQTAAAIRAAVKRFETGKAGESGIEIARKVRPFDKDHFKVKIRNLSS